MVYFLWYVVNPHVQAVQIMYGKGGKGVFKAKLHLAEVDPRFDICHVVNKPLQIKVTPPILVRSLWKQYFENCDRACFFFKTPFQLFFFLENRVNFGRPYFSLKHPLPPVTTHILNCLDMRIHQEASKIYHTYTYTKN